MRHIIQPHERGHRAPLSKDEPTVQYSIRLVRSTRERLQEAGTAQVRAMLDEWAKSPSMAQEPPQDKGRPQKQKLTCAVRHAKSGTAHMRQNVVRNTVAERDCRRAHE